MSEETLKQPEVAAEAAPIAASDAAEGAAEGAAAPAKKVRAGKSIPAGIAFIRSTFNNTQVSIADARGGVIAWSSAGKAGFKGSRKCTAFAATMVAQDAARTMLAGRIGTALQHLVWTEDRLAETTRDLGLWTDISGHYTLLRLRGRHPLCASGVVSVIIVTRMPAA